MQKLIVMVGPKQSGKDTALDLLKQDKLVDAKIAMAGPLKEICMKTFDLHRNLVNDVDLKELPFKGGPKVLDRKLTRKLMDEIGNHLPPVDKYGRLIYNINKVPVQGFQGRSFETPRVMLQQIGTEFIRNRVHEDYHLLACTHEAYLKKIGITDESTAVITDCRFLNEYQFLRDNYGAIAQFVYVERPEAEKQLAEATHASELGVLDIKADMEGQENSIVIKNDGTLEQFKTKLIKALGLGSTTEEVVDEQPEKPKAKGRRKSKTK